ncbi:threonine synthase [Canibacter zhoujuaniae]|uniref:threonine synthase n=1 Tax=Canibacter zhoujuaniae TaxID=2708343 RepID=UPI0014245849|nr:threonine synthase [Canibacter zhoujuaniae]
MDFVSTRGGMQPASFGEILIEGLAPDGGLTVPVDLPRIALWDIEAWRGLSYSELAAQVIMKFWTDIDPGDLEEITYNAYRNSFNSPEVVPVTELTSGFGLVGLSEGPTLAFKDMAMQFLGEAIPYVLKQTNSRLNIVGATSGDTGSAAEYAFRSKPNVSVIMLSPKGRMSDFQRAQMYSLDDDNIHNIVIDGVFDDCQNLMKQLNADLDFKKQVALGAVNSVNLGRVVAQSVYYFWAWLRITDKMTEQKRAQTKVSFAVPSGNFGNVLSGLVAKQMGVPINKLVVATNENNVLHEFFSTGVYRPRSAADTHITSSPSMDISKASNVERLIYDVLGRDPEKLLAAFKELDETGVIDLSHEVSRFKDEFGIYSATSTHADRLRTIKEVFENTGVIIDPHTADGVNAALAHRDDDEIMYVLETAKPQKFAETVIEAVGKPAELTAAMEEMLTKPQKTVDMGVDIDALRDFVLENAV